MGNNVSANTLFHFTGSLENIKNILFHEFYPRYSLEDCRMFIDEGSPLYEYYERAIPMVCFCDIPLSQIGNHIGVYGGYAIGLSKEWGKTKKISPVMYTAYNSSSTEAIKQSIARLLTYINYENLKNHELFMDMCKIQSLLDSFVAYTKPYRGKLFRNDVLHDHEVVFYDEREWRYIPDVESLVAARLPPSLNKSIYMDPIKNKNANEAVKESFALSFEPKDIKYIIVKDDADILPMIDIITNAKGPKYSYDDVRVLMTRIIASSQILNDF